MHINKEIFFLASSIEIKLLGISLSKWQFKYPVASIPTEFNTEVLCYEFKGKINEVEFIEYINAQTGKEEDTLIVTNTENGTLTE